VEVFRRSTKTGFIGEIGCVDHERITIPITHRIAPP
jgi:hypothetical protein